MGFVIRMDNAGYGPNLSPLVLTATVREVPGRPHEDRFLENFMAALSSSRRRSSSP